MSKYCAINIEYSNDENISLSVAKFPLSIFKTQKNKDMVDILIFVMIAVIIYVVRKFIVYKDYQKSDIICTVIFVLCACFYNLKT